MFDLVQMRKQEEELKKEILSLTATTKDPLFRNQEVRMQVLTAEQIKMMSDHHWLLSQRIKMSEK